MSLTRFRVLLAAAVIVAAASWLVVSCTKSFLGSPSRTTPVVLISIDTLRSDHLPAYGYNGVATPNIDALRSDSILYERAYSQVPLTLPSHTSILTGMLPGDHGVRDNVGFRLGTQIPTVQELLRKNGYATGAAVSAFVLRHETGIARGFDFFDDDVQPIEGQTIIGRVQREGHDTWVASQKWLDAHLDQPFFFFLHLYDPHTPYTPPEPYFSRYSNHYDGEIAYSDSVVGDLIADLKQHGVYDKALIILLSDHGEGLNQHGEEEHGVFLYREVLQVPLLVKLPGSRKAGATVKTPVELVDVFPTILDRTATPLPTTGHRPGESLLDFLNGGPSRQIYAETYYPKFHFGWSDLHSLIDGNDHYIRAPKPELYDLAADPGEKNNTLESNRRAYVKMRSAIEAFVQQASAPANIDPEEAAKLAALGYVGSTVATKEGEQLRDPKDMLGAFHDIRVAYTEYRDGDEEKALTLTDHLLESNGQITDLWDLKSKILWKMGKQKESLEAAKDGLRHVPGAIALLYDVANLALTMGDLETAQQHAEIAVKIEPGEAHQILARIALRRGQTDKAVEEAMAAVQTAHDPTSMLMMLATIEKTKGNMAAALNYIDRAAEQVSHKKPPKLEGLHLSRGDVLARLGRTDEAEREFHAEISDFPKTSAAYASLIMLLATQRRLDEATKIVFEAVKAIPEPHTYAVIAETLVAIGDTNGATFWISQGLQHYPADGELRTMPARLRDAAPLLRKQLMN
jgi:arylsulfatase A-like enzyme/predicted Zn-dependent protease